MKKWAGLFGLVIVAIIVMADTRSLGWLARLYDFPEGDKVGHFVLYGILSLLVNLAAFERWPNMDRKRLALRVSAVLAILIGLEEFSQRFFPPRNASVWDLAASYLGVAVFAWLAVKMRRRKVPSPPASPIGRGETVRNRRN